MTFSPSTLALFDTLIKQVQVPASAPNFDELAAQVSTAKKELAAASE